MFLILQKRNVRVSSGFEFGKALCKAAKQLVANFLFDELDVRTCGALSILCFNRLRWNRLNVTFFW